MRSERHNTIQRLLDSQGEVALEELHRLCPECSLMTLRRDLISLEEQGVLRRTRGGAVALSRLQQGVEGRYSLRAQENVEQKNRIAQRVVGLLKDDRSLYLDSGTTLMCVAKALRGRSFNVITSGANIALELAHNHACTVTLLGGQLNPNTLSSSGSLAMEAIERVNIDAAIMGTSGFTLRNGFTSGSSSEHELKRSVISRAREVFMVMDASKLDRSLPFTFATLTDIDALICDAALPEDIMLEARLRNTNVYTG